METENLDLPFKYVKIKANDLKLVKAIEFYNAIKSTSYAHYIGCLRIETGAENYNCSNNDEVIIVDVEPEVGQQPINDIRYTERIAVLFTNNDTHLPWVYSLRRDFPFVPHLNSMPFESPKSLCLYETPYTELKLYLTGIAFLERIRQWLKLTSEGKLHQDDQPLEPFWIDIYGSIILPNPLKENTQLIVYQVEQFKKRFSLIAFYGESNLNVPQVNKYIPIVFSIPPQIHGIIRKTPRNLNEFDALLKNIGINLIEDIIKPKLSNYLNASNLYEHNIILIINIPKKRNENDTSTFNEYFSFLTQKSLLSFACDINLWDRQGNMVAKVIPETAYDLEKAKKIDLFPLSTYFAFNKSYASLFNSIKEENTNRKIGIIGVGALGSQIFMNMTRMGYGKWLLIDNDILLPHNLARHALGNYELGLSKSKSLSIKANEILNDASYSSYLYEDYLNPTDSKKLQADLCQMEVILDASATISVARKLSGDFGLPGRRISIFLNPTGTDLILLAEDRKRKITLDIVEMQYYGLLLKNKLLNLHLENNVEQIRYSNSCRDLSSRINQANISLFSGIACNAIQNVIENNEAKIIIWQQKGEGEIKVIAQDCYKCFYKESNNWKLIINENLVNVMSKFRQSKLPNETGGILIGAYDIERKTVYVVDTILSPSDSQEYPYAYKRGLKGIKRKLDEISRKSGDNLMYIGEWHSHPKDCSLKQSNDDKILFGWIKEDMAKIGYPPLMIILGDKDKFEAYM